MTMLRIVLAVLSFGLWAVAAAAQTGITLEVTASDPDAPIEIKSANLEVDRETGLAIFTGDVVVVQADLRMTAARVEVTYDEAARKVQRVVAIGEVVYASPREEAEAQEAVYEPATGRLQMRGEVLVVQEGTAIAGDVLDADLTTGEAVMTGNVRSIFGSGG